MTTEDLNSTFATLCRTAHEALAHCKSDTPFVSLDELEAHTDVGYYDLRELCRERAAELQAAGLGYADTPRPCLFPADNPPVPFSPAPSDAVTGSLAATLLNIRHNDT